MHKCSDCGVTLSGIAQCASHHCLSGDIQEQNLIQFKWIILLPGPGHVEMNILKAFAKLTWSVFWEDMAEVFNSVSENAKKIGNECF